MGVIDTFVFLMETDNRNALQGMRETERAERDVTSGAHVMQKSLFGAFDGVAERVGLTTGSLKSLAVATLGVAGAGLSLDAVLDHTAEMLAKVRDAETVGIDISQYDALSRTFQSLGVEADAFRDSMIDLNESIGEGASDAKSGKAQAFKALGVSLKDNQGNIKSADEALLELSDTMSKMDKQQATFQIKQLGITDNAVIAAMLNGRKELERQVKFQKELGVTTEKDAEQLKEFSMAQNELSAIFGHFADELTRAVVPALDLLIDTTMKAIEWSRKHKGVLVGAFGAAGVAIIVAGIMKITKAMSELKVQTLLAMWPVALIAAAIIALGLVIDDLWNYFNGGKSVIGDLIQRFPVLGEVLEGAKERVLGLWDALKILFTNPSQFMNNLIAEMKRNWDTLVCDGATAAYALVDTLSRAWDKLSDDTKQVFSDLFNWITNIFSSIGDYISDSVSNAARDAVNKAKDFLGLSDDEAHPMATSGAPAVAANNVIIGAANAPQIPARPATAATGGTKTVTNNQNIENVNITTGSGDPRVISGAVADGMNEHARQLAAQYDDGVSY